MSSPGAWPFAFRCRRSGNCCARPEGVVRVDAADVTRIASHLGLSEAGFRGRYLAAGRDRLVDGPGSRCVFLADGVEPTCTIYPVRPARCRSWPFWPELRDDRDALAAARRLCPGITEGITHADPDARNPCPS
ncbi:MAG: YkgJ family cysteine cluster protein [Planctomycetes bacterium]|nr:YkgJ family cysteine cluster protein [Planctomycetota bacterium]